MNENEYDEIVKDFDHLFQKYNLTPIQRSRIIEKMKPYFSINVKTYNPQRDYEEHSDWLGI